MNSPDNNPWSYRSLIGHAVWTFGEAVGRGVSDLSPYVLLLYNLSLPILIHDKDFKKEWSAYHKGATSFPPGVKVSRESRFTEFGLIISSLYRSGTIHAKALKAVSDPDLFRDALENQDQEE